MFPRFRIVLMTPLLLGLLFHPAFVHPALADSVSVLNIGGGISITNGNIAFFPLGGSSGDFTIGPPPATGVFSGLTGTGVIMDLNDVSEPINTLVDIPDFMTFSSDPNDSFTLTELLGGTFAGCDLGPPAAGQVCTPPGTPYNLSNQSATSSVASFEVEGLFVDASAGTSTPFQGTFATQFTNTNYQTLLNDILGPNPVPVQATYAANFATIPEPASAALIFPAGLGLIALAIGARMIRVNRAA